MPNDPTPRRSRARLAIAPPGSIPDSRAEVARALLDQCFPVHPVIEDQALIMSGWDTARLRELQSDPRYLIGRLQQALTALLEADVPPMDATAELLADAIRDAIAYRQECPARCAAGCARCRAGMDKAAAYESLWRELGLITEQPRPRPSVVSL